MNNGEELLPRRVAKRCRLIVRNKRRRFDKTCAVLDSQPGSDTHPKAVDILYGPGIVNKFQFDGPKNEVFIAGSDTRT